MGKTVCNVSRSSRVDTFLHNEDISSNFRSSSEPTLVELLLNGHFRKLQLPPHCHGLDGVPSDTSVTLLLASLSFNPCHFAEQLCRNLHIAIGSSHLILIHVSLRIALSCSLKGGYSSRSESQFYPKLVTLLFSFDKIAIKDELESGSSIDGGITRG